ncbi:MAG: hypothetical protein K8W52_44940 [Deltaproteobacteria bacterium]|nr:hypothetical protein [Deltaproteobacteria bacterium]
MAAFTDDDRGALDFELLRDGATTLYRRRTRFEAAIDALAALGYVVHRIDAATREEFERGMTRALDFEGQFGYAPWTGSLDALVDAFRGVAFAGRGVVFAFLRLDALHAVEPALARGTLDILEGASRDYLLYGLRLIGLVQTDDPDLDLGALGGRGAQWNRSEWLAADRRAPL